MEKFCNKIIFNLAKVYKTSQQTLSLVSGSDYQDRCAQINEKDVIKYLFHKNPKLCGTKQNINNKLIYIFEQLFSTFNAWLDDYLLVYKNDVYFQFLLSTSHAKIIPGSFASNNIIHSQQEIILHFRTIFFLYII